MNTKTIKTIVGCLAGLLTLLLSMQDATAQLVLNKPGATGEYTAPTTVTLSPGFQSTGNFRAWIAPAAAALGNAASANQNYIQKTVYLRGYGNTPPTAPTVAEALRDITYYDGLGRPVQEVGVKAAPNQRDVVTPVEYDAFGRQHRDYLPYATATGAGGAFKAGAATAQASYYNSPPAGVVQIGAVTVSGVTFTPSFGERRYEASPLDRVVEQGFPGPAWQPGTRTATGGRTVMTDRAVNDAVTGFGTNSRRVARYGVTVNASTGARTLTLDGIYAAGELYVTVTRDENWVSADGRSGTVEEYTDKQGRVVLKRAYNGSEVLSTYYVYDDFGLLCFVLPPGRGTEFNPDGTAVPSATVLANYCYQYRYDGRGRLVEKQLPGRGREYIVYNKLDQAVATQDAVQRMKSPQQWTVTKYDAHGRVVQTGFYSYGATAGTDYRTTVQGQADGQAAGNQWEERNTAGTAYTNRAWPTSGVTVLTEQFYDDYSIAAFTALPAVYRPSGYSTMTRGLPTVSRVQVLGTAQYLWSAVYYDDRGNAVREIRQHYRGGSGGYATNNYDDVATEYSFTGQALNSTRRHYASGSLSATVRTEHTRDHRERPVDTWKRLNTGTRTLIARNAYNEVGQLRSRSLHSTDGTSFAETVNYSYNPRGWLRNTVSPKFRQYLRYDTLSAPQFNGNIRWQQWQHGSATAQQYNYTYDRLNRLLTGLSGSLGETVTYDRSGNIATLKRDAGAVWTYGYTAAQGHRLQTVTGGAATYTYDANGNMTLDGRQNRAVAYNELNLPRTVGGTNAATYTYDATGRKLRSVVGTITTDYIDGIEWEGTSLNQIHMEEGRILPSGVYDYVLRDHLGNSRSGFSGNSPATANLRLDYHPFGLKHPTGNIEPSSPKNRYLYNGKELQDGSGYYDYGARFYDPVIGRWGSVDPLAENYYDLTPYDFVGGNPINRIDPDGRAWYTRYVNEQGETLLNTDDGRDDVVVVPSARLDEFLENAKWNRRTRDAPGWNDNWREEFGIAISEDLLDQIGYFGLSSEKSREASIEYLFGSRSYQSFVWEEVKGQWGNPVLVTTGLLAGAHGSLGMFRSGGITPPKGWTAKPSKKGGGVIFQDPSNTHSSIRQMPGNPNSPNAAQRGPYVIFKKNGVAYDVNGNALSNATDPAAHIPLKQFDINKMPKL
ncbi:DUF6443 domain-containing protein [Parapedobacter sp. DT-150]|uniref:DUF6443 domain-containing protein n=1 Tax=Parapedobacter sp. DT-150 TaxID=3396162 RepID=UPI003F1BC51C